ncbi:TylF/MycF family methyltransferase [Sphingobium sp. BYY-5]|uniref:TylF/MycF/NovP-related O-methyltransferase n=1 Tax=Sphingobium sp. BYY-5 TaxID=2926400 RepID=UPI001FA7BE8B|nr:TylF/MycF/NovP-related O-methyltransferase [Sphingobium sp. BYY-5]MCI4592659.1 TylF/MycF family methyltransferase [Sphingobium sp. BYY-5]
MSALPALRRRMRHWTDVARLSRISRQIRRERLTYLPARKLLRIEAALSRIRRRAVRGDIVEFGVALGGSAILLAHHARSDRRFFGLDVFAMIPPPASERDDARSKQRYDIIASGKAEGLGGDTYYGYRDDLFDQVASQLARYGTPVDGDRVNLVKGLFQDSLPTLDIEQIAFAHIDCDWYEPVRYCLNQTAECLTPGGLVVIDDYHDYKGCREAVDEFLADRPDFRMKTGPNPVLHRRD